MLKIRINAKNEIAKKFTEIIRFNLQTCRLNVIFLSSNLKQEIINFFNLLTSKPLAK